MDLAATGAWARWRRSWSAVTGSVQATYLTPDGTTVTLTVGSGRPVRRLRETFSSSAAANSAALERLARSDADRDSLTLVTGLLPSAQVLQPLRISGGSIVGGLPDLVVREIQHRVGGAAATTTITAAPPAV